MTPDPTHGPTLELTRPLKEESTRRWPGRAPKREVEDLPSLMPCSLVEPRRLCEELMLALDQERNIAALEVSLRLTSLLMSPLVNS